MDKRILKTRQKLGNALIELLQEQAFHQITIRQITERANVAYSTFFRNFETVEELLIHHLNQVLDEIRLLNHHEPTLTFRETSHQIILNIFDHVSQNQVMYRTLLRTSAVRRLLETLKRDLIAQNLELADPFISQLRADTPPLQLVMHNTVAQLFAMIEWWITEDSAIEVATMARYYQQLVTFPTWRLLLGNDVAHAVLDIPLP